MKGVTSGRGGAKWTNYLYLLPAAALIGIFFISSIFYTLWLSFYTADGFSVPVFAGFENYRYLFSDPNFTTSLANTLIWVVCSLVISFAIPLLLAIHITRSGHVTLFKNIFYFPNVLSATITGLIIRSMISVYGLPQLFGALGLNSWVSDWLALPRVNTFIMIGCSVWQGIGMNLLLFIVGINNIDASPIEAATIEGAGTVQLYTRVVFPLLKPISIVILLMSLVNSFKVFDSIWVMTKGGPYRSSETLALTMYEESFIRNKLGLGAAVAIVLTVIILFVSYFNVRSTFKPENAL
jgi:multiple sugar transport system permease protein